MVRAVYHALGWLPDHHVPSGCNRRRSGSRQQRSCTVSVYSSRTRSTRCYLLNGSETCGRLIECCATSWGRTARQYLCGSTRSPLVAMRAIEPFPRKCVFIRRGGRHGGLYKRCVHAHGCALPHTTVIQVVWHACPQHAGDWPSAIKKLSATPVQTRTIADRDRLAHVTGQASWRCCSSGRSCRTSLPARTHVPKYAIDASLLAVTQDWKGYRVIDGSLPEPYETAV